MRSTTPSSIDLTTTLRRAFSNSALVGPIVMGFSIVLALTMLHVETLREER